MVIADLDRFKQVNDNLGHAKGDQVIQSFAEALRGLCGVFHGSNWFVSRMGGEVL